MKPQNLTLFFSDDRSVRGAAKELIHQINRTPYLWDRHCRDAAQNKQITIDLMSADVNYTMDESDPGYLPMPGPTSERESNAWGLVHALMAIARRRADDGYGNHFPLAWEIRTVSPGAYRQNANATRLYGLLRSMAAEPEVGEMLEHTIRREFERDHPDDLNRIPADGSLTDIFVEDLAQQPSRLAEPIDAISRLMPQWRALFRRAVDAGRIIIDIDEAHKVLDSLKTQQFIARNAEDIPSIPIAKAGSSEWYGISLLSVMADVVEENGLELRTPMNALPIVDAPNARPHDGTVTEWYQTAVVENASGLLGVTAPAERLKSFANRSHDAIQAARNNESRLDEFVKSKLRGRYYDRALFLIVLVGYSRLLGKDFEGLAQLSRSFRYEDHDNFFLRVIRTYPSIFSPMTSVPDFARELERALKNEEHQLGTNWTWIRQGLRLWYEEKLQQKVAGDRYAIPPGVARKNAPGLFV